MRTALFTSVFFLFIGLLSSQTCTTFQKAEKEGLSLKKLDSLYKNSIRTDKEAGVFTGEKQKDFDKAWGEFYLQLFQYFKDTGIKWGKPTYCFNKIYFNTKGEVEYWFFNFKKEDNIPQETQDKYLRSIKDFSKKTKININADKNFSQCASVDFFDL